MLRSVYLIILVVYMIGVVFCHMKMLMANLVLFLDRFLLCLGGWGFGCSARC